MAIYSTNLYGQSIDNKIAEVKEKINKSKELVKIYKLKETKEKSFNQKNSAFKSIKESFELMQEKYFKSNHLGLDRLECLYRTYYRHFKTCRDRQ